MNKDQLQLPPLEDLSYRISNRLRLPTPAEEANHLANAIRARLPAWEAAGTPAKVLRWLREGIRLPWIRGPPRPFHRGVSFKGLEAEKERQLLEQLQALLDVGAVEPGRRARWVSQAFLVPKPGSPGKWRLVVDLRHINQYLRKMLCRYETLKKLRHVMREGDWMLSLDLQDGFYTVGVHEEHRDYLTFEVAGVGLFRFKALPMGLSASPSIFTSTVNTFVRALRSPLASTTPPKRRVNYDLSRSARAPRRRRPHRRGQGKLPSEVPLIRGLQDRFPRLMQRGARVLPYMDDFLLIADTRAEALELREYTQAVLDILGLRRNPTKGSWDQPVQQIKHLGLGIDSKTATFYVTEDRLERVNTVGRSLLTRARTQKGKVPARQLASFTGLTQSLYLALPAARFLNRSLHDCLGSRVDWNGLVSLTNQARADIRRYLNLPIEWNGRPIIQRPDTAVLWTDASKGGWGGILNNQLQAPAHGFWDSHDRTLHITMLELKAVRLNILSFLDKLRGRRVLVLEDNQAVVHILNSWQGKSPEMMEELRLLHKLTDENNITLRSKYVRSADNLADGPSRLSDSNDWKFNPLEFAKQDARWGPHQVDRFATSLNCQVSKFNSGHLDPATSGVDAFAQPLEDWRAHNNWCNPPWDLLGHLGQHLLWTGAAATVVAPYWPSAAWYPLLRAQAVNLEILTPARDTFLPGFLGNDLCLERPKWHVAIFRIPKQPPGRGILRGTLTEATLARRDLQRSERAPLAAESRQ